MNDTSADLDATNTHADAIALNVFGTLLDYRVSECAYMHNMGARGMCEAFPLEPVHIVAARTKPAAKQKTRR